MDNLRARGHILITGSSATGKSTLSNVLKSRDIPCIDADNDGEIAYWEHKITKREEVMPENPREEWGSTHNWKWKIGKLALLLEQSNQKLVVCGTANNREEAYELFDKVLVLTASREILEHRLKTRENNAFGKLIDERKWALSENERFKSDALQNGLTVIDTSSLTAQEVAEAVVSISGSI